MTSDGKKYFPIKTETACRLKWSASSVYLPIGKTGSCHRASIAQLDKDNFFNFHNLPNKQADRQTMLAGEWPDAGCDYCKHIEQSGGYSDRMFQNSVPYVYPQELKNDPTLTEIEPVLLEVFFQNTCNLACIYCNENFSSQIEKENIKFGLTNKRVSKYEELSPLMWQWLEGNIHKLRRLQILGGEPLIQPDFLRVVEFINTHPNPALELNFVTNLNIKHQNLVNVINQLEQLYIGKKIRRVEILASIEAWGPEQEYIRYGLNCDQFEENFKYLMTKDFIRVGILSTVTSLSIHAMPAFAKKYKEWSRIKELCWYMHFVLPIKEHVLSPHYFDYSIWQNNLEQTLSYIDGNTFDSNSTKESLEGIIKVLKQSSANANKHTELFNYLDAIDSRRNLNWRSVFPWLAKLENNVV